MSLFSGLYTGATGLVTNQNSLNTTAHNLANIGTAGYTRQQVTQANRHYDTVGQSYVSAQQVGLGVSYAEVRAIRDVFLDQRYRIENGRSQYYNSCYETVREIETLFGEMQGTEFQESLTELERTVQELQKNPSDATNQGLLVSKSYTFLERAQAVYSGLTDYQYNINEQIKGLVEKINDFGDRLYELNEQVIRIETAGIERANDIRDQRDKLLDELAGYGKISYKEDVHGAVTVQFEGVDFVTGDYVYHMELTEGRELNEKYEEEIKKGEMPKYEDDFVVPTWRQLGDRPVISSREEISSDLDTDIGALKGLLNSRGAHKATYKDLGLTWDAGVTDISVSGTPTNYGITDYVFDADETGIYINGNLVSDFSGVQMTDSFPKGQNISLSYNGLNFLLEVGEDSTYEDIVESVKDAAVDIKSSIDLTLNQNVYMRNPGSGAYSGDHTLHVDNNRIYLDDGSYSFDLNEVAFDSNTKTLLEKLNSKKEAGSYNGDYPELNNYLVSTSLVSGSDLPIRLQGPGDYVLLYVRLQKLDADGDFSVDDLKSLDGLTFNFHQVGVYGCETDSVDTPLPYHSDNFIDVSKAKVTGLAPVSKSTGSSDSSSTGTSTVPKKAQQTYKMTERSDLMEVEAELDNMIHRIVTAMNQILEGGTDADGKRVNLFKQITEPETDANGNPIPLSDGTDGWSVQNLMIDPAVLRQPTLLTNGFISSGDEKTVDQGRADALADLFLGDNAGQLNPTTRGNLRFSEYYVALAGENAIKGQIYKEVAFNEETAAAAIDAQRQQVVGVSDNEELTNMIRYQNAYNANSRYINTVNAMIDNLFSAIS